jgi:hypothetical protein
VRARIQFKPAPQGFFAPHRSAMKVSAVAKTTAGKTTGAAWRRSEDSSKQKIGPPPKDREREETASVNCDRQQKARRESRADRAFAMFASSDRMTVARRN